MQFDRPAKTLPLRLRTFEVMRGSIDFVIRAMIKPHPYSNTSLPLQSFPIPLLAKDTAFYCPRHPSGGNKHGVRYPRRAFLEHKSDEASSFVVAHTGESSTDWHWEGVKVHVVRSMLSAARTDERPTGETVSGRDLLLAFGRLMHPLHKLTSRHKSITWTVFYSQHIAVQTKYDLPTREQIHHNQGILYNICM